MGQRANERLAPESSFSDSALLNDRALSSSCGRVNTRSPSSSAVIRQPKGLLFGTVGSFRAPPTGTGINLQPLLRSYQIVNNRNRPLSHNEWFKNSRFARRFKIGIPEVSCCDGHVANAVALWAHDSQVACLFHARRADRAVALFSLSCSEMSSLVPK